MNAVTTITLGNWIGHLGMGLAARELQCVLGIAMGQTSKELARDLGVQPESIKKRVLAASTKLGVTRRAQLVAKAFALGLISFACTTPPTPQQQHDQDQRDGVLLA